MPDRHDDYHQRDHAGRHLAPETLMLGYGYDPNLSEGSLKPGGPAAGN